MPGGWDYLNNSVTNTAHEVSGGSNRNDRSAVSHLRHSEKSCSSMISNKCGYSD